MRLEKKNISPTIQNTPYPTKPEKTIKKTKKMKLELCSKSGLCTIPGRVRSRVRPPHLSSRFVAAADIFICRPPCSSVGFCFFVGFTSFVEIQSRFVRRRRDNRTIPEVVVLKGTTMAV
ncbi:hypothetical protein ACOSP7_023458 [Xanthoceras sorbifolium]